MFSGEAVPNGLYVGLARSGQSITMFELHSSTPLRPLTILEANLST